MDINTNYSIREFANLLTANTSFNPEDQINGKKIRELTGYIANDTSLEAKKVNSELVAKAIISNLSNSNGTADNITLTIGDSNFTLTKSLKDSSSEKQITTPTAPPLSVSTKVDVSFGGFSTFYHQMLDIQNTINSNGTTIKSRAFFLRETLSEGQRYEVTAFNNNLLSPYINLTQGANSHLNTSYLRLDAGGQLNAEFSVLNIQIRSGISTFKDSSAPFAGFTSNLKAGPFSFLMEGLYLEKASTFQLKLNYTLNQSLSAFYGYEQERANSDEKDRRIIGGFGINLDWLNPFLWFSSPH